MISHLTVSFSADCAALSEQSAPPEAVSHTHAAVHVSDSSTVQEARMVPEGSEYSHTPLPEQMEPVIYDDV
jgi:hypothetical protein